MSTVDSSTCDDRNPDDDISKYRCRACLKTLKPDDSHQLYQPWNAPWEGMKSTIAQDLAKLTNIELSENDGHSKFVCQCCCVKLYSACRFVHAVRKADQIIKHKDASYDPPLEVDKWPKPIQVDKNVNSTVFETEIDVEIKQEVLSDDDYDSNGAEEGYTSDLAVDIVKIEPEEIDQTPPIKVTVNGTISLDQMGTRNTIITNGIEIYEDEEYLDSSIKEEPMSEDELTPPDLPLDCLLCTKQFNSISGLKAHVITQHSYKSVRRKASPNSPEKKPKNKHVCATCRRSFVTPTDLMVHETCHNKAVCYGCHATYDTFEQLSKHRKRCKTILNKEVLKPKMLEDVIRPLPELSLEPIRMQRSKPTQEPMKCTLCTETFSDSYYMKIHHAIHHASEKEVGESSSSKQSLKQQKSASDDKMETEALQSMFEQTDKNEQIDKREEMKNNDQIDVDAVEQNEPMDIGDLIETEEGGALLAQSSDQKDNDVQKEANKEDMICIPSKSIEKEVNDLNDLKEQSEPEKSVHINEKKTQCIIENTDQTVECKAVSSDQMDCDDQKDVDDLKKECEEQKISFINKSDQQEPCDQKEEMKPEESSQETSEHLEKNDLIENKSELKEESVLEEDSGPLVNSEKFDKSEHLEDSEQSQNKQDETNEQEVDNEHLDKTEQEKIEDLHAIEMNDVDDKMNTETIVSSGDK